MDTAKFAFVDEFNPTPDELRHWAYVDPIPTEQDWDLILVGGRHDDQIFEFASDAGCPRRKFFLYLLYLSASEGLGRGNINGDTPRHKWICGLIEKGANSSDPFIQRWHQRCKDVMSYALPFVTDDWYHAKFIERDERELGMSANPSQNS